MPRKYLPTENIANTSRQSWDEDNYKKLWVAYLKTHPGITIDTEALATEMQATKRALDDHFKGLRREARGWVAHSPVATAQDEMDISEEQDLNIYQKAKRGYSLPPSVPREKASVSGSNVVKEKQIADSDKAVAASDEGPSSGDRHHERHQNPDEDADDEHGEQEDGAEDESNEDKNDDNGEDGQDEQMMDAPAITFAQMEE